MLDSGGDHDLARARRLAVGQRQLEFAGCAGDVGDEHLLYVRREFRCEPAPVADEGVKRHWLAVAGVGPAGRLAEVLQRARARRIGDVRSEAL